MKKIIFLLSTALMIGNMANAQKSQPCGTDEMVKRYKAQYPEIEKYEKILNEQMRKQVSQLDLSSAQGKGTAFGPDDTLHIPIVVHVIHDYATSNYVPDQRIYEMVDWINRVYLNQNTTDLNKVIPTFQPYIGNAKIQFHLATRDPLGNPTKGITHRWSYLTYGGDNQAKFDLWAPDSYINIWLVNHIGDNTGTLAYATPPASAAGVPWYDGVIGEVPASTSPNSNQYYTMPHELGHILNLAHTWGSTNEPAVACGDDDVDDTPPTMGGFHCNLDDTVCNNTYVPTGKILIDSNARVVDSIDGIGINFVAKTGITLQSVNIYPTRMGQGYNITLQDNNGNKIDSVARFSNVGDTTADVAVKSDAYQDKTSAGINFNATTNPVRVEEVTIFPNAIGEPYMIMLTQGADTLDSFKAVTTVAAGPEVVPVGFYIPKGNDYWIYVAKAPASGLKHDAGTTTVTTAPNSGLDFVYYKDNTPGSNLNYYNFLYNWNVRYKGITDTTKNLPNNKIAPHTVALNWTLAPGSYKLVLSENTGLSHDTDTKVAYNKSIQCVIDLSNERNNGAYNYMYNWIVRYGYIKGAGTLCIDYPDTANTQNIMNYTQACKHMFTKGQVERMRKTLASSVAHRDNLVDYNNHLKTGIVDPGTGKYGVKIDLKPVPDFSVEKSSKIGGDKTYYMCADGTAKFRFSDRSWGDTVTAVNWSFTNGANPATVSSTNNQAVEVTVTEPGWVTIDLTATGNNSGDSTTSRKLVYAADPNFKISPLGFVQEFNQDGNIDKWPIFNYYGNDAKWEYINGNGAFDKTCVMYHGFDNRGTNSAVGSPGGDYDDFFTPAFDLSAIGPDANISFMYSGAYRTATPAYMNDSLEIHYSIDCGESWQVVKRIGRQDLSTYGTYPGMYAPLWLGDWSHKSIDIPASAKTDKVFFRFRYKPGVGADYLVTGSGNNFYLDRINISEFPAGINTLLPDNKDITVAPNPTNAGSAVIIRSNSNADAKVVVTDITGKVVYSTQQSLNDKINRIEIPATAVPVKGVYMVQVHTGDKSYTEKLVVY